MRSILKAIFHFWERTDHIEWIVSEISNCFWNLNIETNFSSKFAFFDRKKSILIIQCAWLVWKSVWLCRKPTFTLNAFTLRTCTKWRKVSLWSENHWRTRSKILNWTCSQFSIKPLVPISVHNNSNWAFWFSLIWINEELRQTQII